MEQWQQYKQMQNCNKFGLSSSTSTCNANHLCLLPNATTTHTDTPHIL